MVVSLRMQFLSKYDVLDDSRLCNRVTRLFHFISLFLARYAQLSRFSFWSSPEQYDLFLIKAIQTEA